MKVSVIVCIYNTEHYLRKCVDSVVNQTLSDIEIILVNDCSPDNSLAIVREYEKKDNRVIVINSEKNEGISSSRNKGIKIANGKYFICIDSDDYIAPNMLELLYNRAEQYSCDMAVCNLQRIFDEGPETPLFTLSNTEVLHIGNDKENFICSVFNETVKIGGSVATKLFNTEFVRNSGVCFEERDEIYAEDAFFLFKILKFTNTIGMVNQPLYFYYQRSNSVSHTYKKNYILRVNTFIEKVSDFYEGNMEIQKSLNTRVFTFLMEALENEAIIPMKYKSFKRVLKNKMFIEMIRDIKVENYTKKQKLIYYLYRFRFFYPIYILFKIYKSV